MQLYFIRHAQSENNLIWEQKGAPEKRKPDPDLTVLGFKQANALARFLAKPCPEIIEPWRDPYNHQGFSFTHLYCSLMIRAIKTGTAVAQATGLPLVAWQDIHERGGIYKTNHETGERTGLPGNRYADLAEQFPHLQLPAFTNANDGWWGNKPYEEKEQAFERAKLFWAALRQNHDENDQVAIISHGGFFQSFMRILLGLPVRTAENQHPSRFAINNVSISRFATNSKSSTIIYLNRTDFLLPHLRSM